MTLNQITTWLKIKKRDEKKPIVSKYCKHKKNIVKIFPVPKPNAKTITDERNAFENFFSDDIIKNIKYTNLAIEKLPPNYYRPRDAKHVRTIELLALFVLLYLSGLKTKNYTHFIE